MFGSNPVIFAETAVGVLPVTVAGMPGIVVPYAVEVPYAKDTDEEPLFAFTVPLSVAVADVIAVAAVVTTVGGGLIVVNWISDP